MTKMYSVNIVIHNLFYSGSACKCLCVHKCKRFENELRWQYLYLMYEQREREDLKIVEAINAEKFKLKAFALISR